MGFGVAKTEENRIYERYREGEEELRKHNRKEGREERLGIQKERRGSLYKSYNEFIYFLSIRHVSLIAMTLQPTFSSSFWAV